MSLQRLRYFHAAAETGNFARAAEQLHVAPSALSRQIRHLEIELGVPLFERRGRSVALSRGGSFYFERVRAILAEVERAAEDLRSFARGEAGSLTIGLHELSAMHDVVMQGLRAFRTLAPDCTLNLQPMLSPLQVEGVATGLIDAGFVFDGPDGHPLITRRTVHAYGWELAMPADHPLTTRETITLHDLIDERFVGLRKYAAPAVYDRLHRYLHDRGLTIDYAQYAESGNGLYALIAAGAGLCFVSLPAIVPPGVALRALPEVTLDIRLDLIWRREDRRPLLASLIATIEDVTRAVA